MSNYYGPEQDLNLQPEEKGSPMNRESLISTACAAGLQARVAAALDDATLKKIADAIQSVQPTPDAAAMGGIGGLIAKPAKSKTYMSEPHGPGEQILHLAREMGRKYGPAFASPRVAAAAFLQAKAKEPGLNLSRFCERVANK